MADLKSQLVNQLPIKQLVPLNYQRSMMQRIIDDQVRVIKALQEDMKSLEERITALEP